jgi:hypothetical protein
MVVAHPSAFATSAAMIERPELLAMIDRKVRIHAPLSACADRLPNFGGSMELHR